MSIKGLRFLAAALIAAGALCIAAGAALPSVKSGEESSKAQGGRELSRQESSELTAQYVSREYTADAGKIRAVEITTIIDEVQILSADDDTFKAVFYENQDLWYETELTREGTLKLEQKTPSGSRNIQRKDDDLKLWIYLPAGIERLSVLSVSGDIEAQDLTLPPSASMETTSGDLEVKRCAAQQVTLHSVSGSIDVEADLRELTAESMSGDVDLELWGMPEDYTLEVETVSGKTRAGGGSGERAVKATTISGDIEVKYISAWDFD